MASIKSEDIKNFLTIQIRTQLPNNRLHLDIKYCVYIIHLMNENERRTKYPSNY